MAKDPSKPDVPISDKTKDTLRDQRKDNPKDFDKKWGTDKPQPSVDPDKGYKGW
jgi:hypothetical protein